MKSLNILMVLALLFSVIGICKAATTATINVSAVVPSTVELSWGMMKCDSRLTDDAGVDDTCIGNQTAMSFGTLRHYLDALNTNDAGRWFSQYYFGIFMSAIAGGAKYRIQQTSSGLFFGAIKLPTGAWGIPYIGCWDNTTTPEKDKPCPTGAIKGTPGPAEATNKVLYDSGLGAAISLVRADYAIPPLKAGGVVPYTGYVMVPLSQAAGTYAGTVTITLTTY